MLWLSFWNGHLSWMKHAVLFHGYVQLMWEDKEECLTISNALFYTLKPTYIRLVKSDSKLTPGSEMNAQQQSPDT